MHIDENISPFVILSFILPILTNTGVYSVIHNLDGEL